MSSSFEIRLETNGDAEILSRLSAEAFGPGRFARSAYRVRNAALLGPLVVDPIEKGKGIGRALVQEGLARARAEGFGLVLLVGDMPYYGRFGFQPVPFGQITLPGPVDPARLLALELIPGTLAGAAGQVKAYLR
jgi:predicted N-acetyltransferase YhbS